MPLGIAARLRQLERRLNPANRFIDVAIQLEVYEILDEKLHDTGRRSRVFGGVWDLQLGCYTRDTPATVKPLKVSQLQLDYIGCPVSRWTAKGGRGSGKTFALSTKAAILLIDQPYERGLLLSPVNDLRDTVWDTVLGLLDEQWLQPGTRGIHETKKTIRTIVGSAAQFRSGESLRGLRSWGVSWCGVDEEKDVTDTAIDTAWGCVRQTRYPIMFGAGTPEAGGEYEARFKKMESDDDPDSAVFSMPSKSNPFIYHELFDLLRTQMDEKRYRQEILAEFVEMEPIPYVCKREFDRERHNLDSRRHIARDVTYSYLAKKLRLGPRPKEYRNNRFYLIGVDYNHDYPCYAVVYRLFRGAGKVHWVAVDIVQATGLASRLALALLESGYTPHNSIIVDDASGDYNAPRGKKDPNSSSRLMRASKFKVLHKAANPGIKDRVNAFLAKLDPVQGHPSWSLDLDYCEELAEACENVKWWNGRKIDKEGGFDHIFDAATYPIAFFEPAARADIPRVRKRAG
jgi:hypothetical protein